MSKTSKTKFIALYRFIDSSSEDVMIILSTSACKRFEITKPTLDEYMLQIPVHTVIRERGFYIVIKNNLVSVKIYS